MGTPHHGSSLERVGNYLDVILETTPYAKPFARLGKVRSAGITDLRYGNLIDEDWQGNDRFDIHGDQRHSIPLPDRIEYYNIAAIIGKATDPVSRRLLGDSLVGIGSALGQHKNPNKSLPFKEENSWVAYENTHWDLLNNPNVYDKIRAWLV